MVYYPAADCYDIVHPLYDELLHTGVAKNLTIYKVISLIHYCEQAETFEADLDEENRYIKPMVWIGIYIAIASILCIIAMGADLLHGFINKKMWFPSKYFTLNAASITVITFAMKLPVDLSSRMPGRLNQATRLGSLAFMCTMMANLMPSLASMDNKTLLVNVIGLAILVKTIIVNICIEISTGVIYNLEVVVFTNFYTSFKILAYIYVAMLLWLLVIMIASAITIPSSKQILEFKYQTTGERTLDPENLMSMVEKLRQYVRRYWVMAKTGSPQFVMASNPLSSTVGIICVIILVMELPIILRLLNHFVHGSKPTDNRSDYKWSTAFICTTQLIGVVVGSIAPIFRSFTILNFNLFTKWNKNHFMVFKVEKYWIQRLCEWKESNLIVLPGDSWLRPLVTVSNNLKNLFLGLCIGIQKIIVVSSKMMGLVLIVLSIFVMYCLQCWKSLVAMLFTLPTVPENDDADQDLSDYVLQLEVEMELGERTLKRIYNAMDNLIQKAEKEQNKDLLVFLDTSTGFKGVENFDSDQVEALTSVKLVNSWSLPVVTLTCIAISLPNIPKILVDKLLKSVREGLLVTHLVEEIVNNTLEFGNIRRATMTLWHEVDGNSMWLGKTIEKSAFRGKTSAEILEWFANKAKEIVQQINDTTNGEVVVNTPKELILANSMYRSARTILFNYQINVELSSEKEFFALLSSMIADILCACFTNIPRVIKMKCHESTIEKREGSVEAAAMLFGRTEEILKRLGGVWELPSMDPDKMGFIDEWRLHLKQSIT